MSITFPKPKLLGPKIPSLVVAGLLAAQFLLFGGSHSPDPKCTLTVERPHHSTYLKEFKNIDAIKLNISSSCNVPQLFTEITSRIQKIANNRELTGHNFRVARVSSDSKNSHNVFFKDLFVDCKFGRSVQYLGIAEGYVQLRNGQKYPVSGSSSKFVAVPCEISAK